MNEIKEMNVKQDELLSVLRENLKSLLDSELNDFADIAEELIQHYKTQKYVNEKVYLRRRFSINETSSSRACNQDLS